MPPTIYEIMNSKAFDLHYLTQLEAAQIEATFFYTFDSDYQCDNMVSELKTKGYEHDRIQQVREMRGCIGVPTRHLSGVQNIKYAGCYCRYRMNAGLFNELWRQYNIFKDNGIFPDGCSYYDQPAKLMEVFSLFDSLSSFLKHREAEKQSRKERQRKGSRR